MGMRDKHDEKLDQHISQKRRSAQRVASKANTKSGPLLIKIFLLGLFDALCLYSLFVIVAKSRWIAFVAVLAVAALINWIYWREDGLAAKYLTPGLVFLLVFQLFAITYSGYIAFTNYGTGHNGSKEQAITSLMQSALTKVPDSDTYQVSVVQCKQDLEFVVTSSAGKTQIGDSNTPLHSAMGVITDNTGHVTKVQGCEVLSFNDVLNRQDEILNIDVPISKNPDDGMLQTTDGQTAYIFKSTLSYDDKQDTMTNTQTGAVYKDKGSGAFIADNGDELKPGWRINVGFSNFTRVFTSQEMRGPFLSVVIWTIEFSVISVVSTFLLGLFLAIVFNDSRMRGRRIYRSILILPYAFPAFLSALVWAGLLNEKFGFINQVLLGGSDIAWLQSPNLAKVAILVVNLWLGFPYMFLVCMGALQSIPEDLSEAAKLDGASAWQIFRLIKFPLLLVSVAPLLISSFAMNFNNFNLIYMLTAGGPVDTSTGMNIGSTDILISMVYKIAFVGADRDYGLASAFAIIIFFVVALVSAIGFRTSKSLEELN